MANFGLTPQGFILKRLSDILAEQRQIAIEKFQDLVPVGEVVDVSDSSLLGRLIALTQTLLQVFLLTISCNTAGYPDSELHQVQRLDYFPGITVRLFPVVVL